MRFEGTLAIRAPREMVWRFLTDPDKVSRCAPGLESIEVIEPGARFRAVASVGFGVLKATFANEVAWLDLEPPSRARMKVHGTAPGSAVDATSEMLLTDGPEGATALRWTADVSVVGTIASIAARLMGSVAQRLTDAFFDAVRCRIEAHREFRFGPLPLDQAEGKILGHSVAGADGRTALRKGRPLAAEDIATLRELGRAVVYVAELGTDDVGEDAAAHRIAEAAAGAELRLSGAAAARVNLVATARGILRVEAARLGRVNEIEGIAFATPLSHSVVRPGQVVATVKIIPYALPDGAVVEAERLAREGGPLLRVDALPERSVGLILSGPPSARDRITRDFEGPLRARVEALGSRLAAVDFVPLEDEAGEESLAEALQRQARAGAGLIVLAGETAIVDPPRHRAPGGRARRRRDRVFRSARGSRQPVADHLPRRGSAARSAGMHPKPEGERHRPGAAEAACWRAPLSLRRRRDGPRRPARGRTRAARASRLLA